MISRGDIAEILAGIGKHRSINKVILLVAVLSRFRKTEVRKA